MDPTYTTLSLTPYKRFSIAGVPLVVLPTDEGLVLAVPTVHDGYLTATDVDIDRLVLRHQRRQAEKERRKKRNVDKRGKPF